MPHPLRLPAVGENLPVRVELNLYADQLAAIDARRRALGAGRRRPVPRGEAIRALLDEALGLAPGSVPLATGTNTNP